MLSSFWWSVVLQEVPWLLHRKRNHGGKMCGDMLWLDKIQQLVEKGMLAATTLDCFFLTWHDNPGRPRRGRGQRLIFCILFH